MKKSGFKKQAVLGLIWITFLRIVTRGLTFVRLAVLGRYLTPFEFGLFGIASLILSFLEVLTETGINVFLIQQKGNFKKYINSAWLISILRGFILFTIILMSSGFIAEFFNTPESKSIIMLISLVPLIKGFINPAIIVYQKELIFKKEFGLRTFLFFIDIFVSIIAVIITKNALSFVWGLIASAMIEVLISHLIISLKPKLEFSQKKLNYVFLRGKWVTLTSIFSYLADNGDNLSVGKILGSTTLGLYQVAYKFSTLPISEISNVVNQVVFPVYSKIANDKIRLRKALIKVTVFTTIAAFIMGLPIFIFAKEIILFVMGEKWITAVPVIQILAIYGIFRALFGSFSPLFLSVERQDYVAKMTFVRMVGLLLFIFPLTLNFGLVGAGYAMLISVMFEIPIIVFYVLRVFK